MSSVSQSVKCLRELVASISRRKRRRRRQTRLTYPLTARAAFLAVEPLEPRLLLSTTQPFDPVNNLNGYMDLGGDLRFMLESDGAAWTQGASSAIWQVQQNAAWVGPVPQAGSPYVPLLELAGNVAVNRSTAQFMLGVTSQGSASISYTPQGHQVSFNSELFDLQQDTPWLAAADVVGAGVSLDSSIVNAADTAGVSVAPNRGTLYPSGFQIDGSQPSDPLLVMNGDLSIFVPKLLQNTYVQKVLDKLHIDFGTATHYSVTADMNDSVRITQKNVPQGYWATMATKEFTCLGFGGQIQQAEVDYDPNQDLLSVVGDVKLSWHSSALYLQWGTGHDNPGLVLQGTDNGWDIVKFAGDIGTNGLGADESSQMTVADSTFSISNAGFAFDHTDETLKLNGTVSWTLGDQAGLTVSLGTASNPGLVLRDGELVSFDATVTSGSIKVKSLDVALSNVDFAYDRYYHGGAQAASPYTEPVWLGDIAIRPMADQFYHPGDTTGAVDVVVNGAAAGAPVTVTATSSDEAWLANSMLIVTRTSDSNIFQLAIDADPNTPGDQAPTTLGQATVTVTAGDGVHSTISTFDVTVGDEQLVFSGSAQLSIGDSQVSMSVLPSQPWTWTDENGNWDWHVGSLIIDVNGQFGFGPLSVQAHDLQISYTSSVGGDTWTVGGSATFPALFNASIAFGSAANPGLTIQNGDWQVTDLDFSLNPPHIGAFGLTPLHMHYAHPQNQPVTLDFDGGVVFPGGFSVEAAFDIVGGELQMIRIDYDAGTSEGIVIGDTGVFITKMGAEIDDLTDSDVTVKGDISFAAGPSMEIAGQRRAYLTGDGSFWVNRHGMEFDVDIVLEGGVSGTGEGKLILDWQARDYRAQVSVTMLGGVFEAEANFELKPHSLILGAKADVKIPSFIPYIGGKELADIDLLLSITPDDKFVAAWAHFDIDLKVHTWDVWLGVEYDFTDRKFSLIGHKEIDKLQGQMPDQNQPFQEVQAFTMPATANGASFEATWDHYDSSVQVFLLPPGWASSVQITSDMQNHTISASGQPSYVVSVLPDRTSPTSLAFVVRPSGWSETDPAQPLTPGAWNVAVVSNSEVWPDLSGSFIQPQPTLSLDVAGAGRNTANVTYNWQSADPDHSTLTLYYDDDRFGYDGHSFATVTPFTKPSNYTYFAPVTSEAAWTAASLENLQHSPYYVYGILDDGTGIPLYTNYSAHAITPQPALLAKVNVLRGVDADKSGWTVKVLDTDGNIVNTVDGFACSRQTDDLGEVAFNVPAGTYTVVMTRMTSLYVARPGQGQDEDDNGNLIQTVVVSNPATQTVTPSFIFAKRSEISGRVFADTNANGVQDPSDLPLEAWQVYLDVNGNGRLDGGEPVDATDNDGMYALYVDPPAIGDTATWQVRQQTLPPDYELVAPDSGFYQVTLATAPDGIAPAASGRDFLDARVTSVAGIVYDDVNGNGVQDAGEPGLPGVTVTLTPQGGTPVTAKTDSAGRYILQTELAAGGGDYQVTVQPPAGTAVTAPAFSVFDFGQKITENLSGVVGVDAQDARYSDLLAADFNADGNDDMLVMVRARYGGTGQPGTACALFLHTASGYAYQNVFFLPTPGPNAAQGTQLWAGNLDGDPTPEIVTVTDAGQVVVADYTGGNFTSVTTFTDKLDHGGAYARVALVDLNGDGLLDILGNDGHAWINGGALHFTRNSAKSLPNLAVAAADGGTKLLVSGDFTGTGHARSEDTAFAYETYNGQVAIVTYQQTAIATYSAVQNLIVPGVTLLGLTAGDVNGDGRTDLAVVTREQTAQGLQAFLRIFVNEQGSLVPADAINLGSETLVGSLKIRDIDHDGDGDIGFSGERKLLFAINEGRGEWSLQPRTDYASGETAGDYPSFDVAHLSQFTVPGILVDFNRGGNNFAYTLYRPATQTEHLYETQLSESRLYSGFDFGLHGGLGPTTAQITGTVFDDRDTDQRQSLDENGLEGATVQLVNASSGAVVATATTDALGDYVFSAPAAGNYRVQLADSSLRQTTPMTEHLVIGAAVNGPSRIDILAEVIADFNGDGREDLASVTPTQIIVEVSGAPSDVVTVIPGGLHGPDPSNVPFAFAQIGDLDRDGDPDILLSVQDSVGDWDLMVFSNQGDGSFQVAQSASSVNLGVAAADQQAVSTPRLVDLNGDGRPDLLWFSEASAKAYVLLNTGGVFAAADPTHTITLPHALGTAARLTPDVVDLNGDGLLDLVVVDPIANALVFVRGYGLGAFSSYLQYPLANRPGGAGHLNNAGGAVVVRDLDADGLPDLTIASQDGVEILWNNGGFQFAAETLAAPHDLPGWPDIQDIAVVVDDLTGDGLPDWAIAYAEGPGVPERTYVTVIQNLGGGTFGQPLQGLSSRSTRWSSALLSGDLDGDDQAEFLLCDINIWYTGNSANATVWPNQSWNEDHFSVSYAAGADLGGYNFGAVPPASTLSEIQGAAFQDRNSDKLWEANEAGIFGLTVYADLNGNSQHDVGEPLDETDLLGTFRLTGLAADSYDVRAIVPSTYNQTTANPGTIKTQPGETVQGVLFGLHPNFPINDPPVAGFGYALALDGVNDGVELGAAPFNGQAAWTFSAWINPSHLQYGMLYSEGNPSATLYIAMASNGSVSVGAWNAQQSGYWINFTTPAGVIAQGQWSFVAVRLANGAVGSGNVTVFVNDSKYSGSLQAAHDTSTKFAALGANVGGLEGNQGLDAFPGLIDEVRLWTVALADTDIRTTQFQPLHGTEHGLAAWYRFDENVGLVAHNASSGDANDKASGSLVNGASWNTSGATVRTSQVVGNSVNGTLFGNDPNHDALHFVLAEDGTYGHVAISASTSTSPVAFTYTPTDPLWTGTDTFTFFASDGGSWSALPYAAQVLVQAKNQAPEATGDNAICTAHGSVTVFVLANDSDLHNGAPGENNQPLAVDDYTWPLIGSVTLSANRQSVTYRARGAGYTDSFKYRVIDSRGGISNWATVTIQVQPAPLPSWHNSTLPSDVNDNGITQPVDALILINEINVRTIIGPNGELPAAPTPPPFYDVNDDGRLTSLDVLIVIQVMNGSTALAQAAGEAGQPDEHVFNPSPARVSVAPSPAVLGTPEGKDAQAIRIAEADRWFSQLAAEPSACPSAPLAGPTSVGPGQSADLGPLRPDQGGRGLPRTDRPAPRTLDRATDFGELSDLALAEYLGTSAGPTLFTGLRGT